MNQKLSFLCFRGIHNSLLSFWAQLGYSQIKIDLLSLCFTHSSLELECIFLMLNFCNSLLRFKQSFKSTHSCHYVQIKHVHLQPWLHHPAWQHFELKKKIKNNSLNLFPKFKLPKNILPASWSSSWSSSSSSERIINL